FSPDTAYPVIHLMEGQRTVGSKGGTMRLGAYPCVVKKDTKTYKAYGTVDISERHRHRYEVNNTYRQRLVEKGVEFSGLSPDGRLVEIVEYPGHPWFVACQFHPEFKSSPMSPHPLFKAFIKAVLAEKILKTKTSKSARKKPSRRG
ncbi:MAG: hypothetical protein HY880_05940, partial [Deltaproteobacteria bacterium]|nr:hypothetical protein [Deltaproteobacteria bacterium]